MKKVLAMLMAAATRKTKSPARARWSCARIWKRAKGAFAIPDFGMGTHARKCPKAALLRR